MKIINEGSKELKTELFGCKNCGAVFEADPGEYGVKFGYTESGADLWSVNCPVCRNKIEFLCDPKKKGD